jgi:AraC-like DNA-binding protein
VGFLSDVNFSRVFKKHMEMSPGKYRDESDG